MEQMKIALAETATKQAFAIVWPLSNDRRQVNRATADAATASLGGIPVLVAALAENGELHTFGPEPLGRAVVETGLDGRRWVLGKLDFRPEEPGRDLGSSS